MASAGAGSMASTKAFGRPRSIAAARMPKSKTTGSAFDRTVIRSNTIDRPGIHTRTMTPPDPAAFAPSGFVVSSGPPDPRLILTGHSGTGGAASTIHRRAASAGPTRRLGGPPAGGSRLARPNPTNTELRRVYERSDLPCVVDQRGVHNRLTWKAAVGSLDYGYYLPLFFDGLREEEWPYKFIAVEGTKDLLLHGGPKILPVVPQLIIPLRNAISTRRPGVMLTALDALQRLILADVRTGETPMIGRALVPFYRQILPILNIFITSNKNIGDRTDYGQRFQDVLGDRIQEVLNLLEIYGGEDAFVNIKYLVPTYQSCVRSSGV